jgi:hypothetical protein
MTIVRDALHRFDDMPSSEIAAGCAPANNAEKRALLAL